MPLAGAEISRYFEFDGSKYTPVLVIVSDSHGKFEGTINPGKLPATFLALDKDRKLGARVVLTSASVKKPLRIVLKPLAAVSFSPDIEAGYQPTAMSVSLRCGGAPVLWSYGSKPLLLPEGQYDLVFGSMELQPNHRTFFVRAGQKVDLGRIPLAITPISRNVGKPAMPIDYAEARGVPNGFRLADLKGKWVLMEFWGFW